MIKLPRVIHVVDDDAAFRTMIARLLRASGYQIALYESAHRLLEAPLRGNPGCILLDVRKPGRSGPELQERLAERGNRLPIIFLTGHGDVAMGVLAIKAGADDFLLKPATKNTLLEAIERALARYDAEREQGDGLDKLRALVSTLTRREGEVFALIVRGKINKQIAYELGRTERTIKAHRRAVMEKLEVESLAEAVSIAERLGMLAS